MLLHDNKTHMQRFRTLLSAHRILAAVLLAGVIVLLGFLSFRFPAVTVLGGLLSLAVFVAVLIRPWAGLLLLTFFIPFERIGSIDIAGATVRPSQVTALLTLFALVLLVLSQRRFTIPRLPHLWPLAVFVVVSMVGLFHAPNVERSILVLLFTVFTFCISLLTPLLVRDRQQLTTLARWMFASMAVVTLFGLYQFVGDLVGLPPELTGLRELYTKDVLGFPRVQSTALEPLYFANYLLVPLSLLLSLFLSKERVLPQWQVIGLFAVGVVNVVLTVARGGYIAFAASVLVLLAAYYFSVKLLTWRNFLWASSAVALAAVVFFQVMNVQTVSENFFGHVSNLFGGASYNERVEMYEIARSAWMTHPWVGIGPGSFGPYASWHPYVVPEHGWRIVNNEYLELLAEQGIIGAAMIVLVFLIVIVRSTKALLHTQDAMVRAIHLGVLAGFVGILVQYNTFSILYIVHIWFTIGLLIALQNMALQSTAVSGSTRSNSQPHLHAL